jgi:hypothetical protein
MQVQNDISRGLKRTIEEAAESWKAHRRDAHGVRDVDYLVRECLGMHQFLREWQAEVWHSAFANAVQDLQATGEMLHRALDRGLEVFQVVRACVEDAVRLGYPVARADELERAADDTRRMRDDLLRRWPRFGPDMLERSRAEQERGQTQGLEEAFDELRHRTH